VLLVLLVLLINPTQCFLASFTYSIKTVEGKYISLQVHDDVDEWVIANTKQLCKLIDNVTGNIIDALEVNITGKINITIISPTLGKKLGVKRIPFLLTDRGIILVFTPYERRGALPFPIEDKPVEDKDLLNMNYVLGWIIDGITIYLLLNNVSYWHNDAAFGLMEALITYFLLKIMPSKYIVTHKLLKYPHGFTASMINLGYYKPLEEAIINYRSYARSYAWEVDSFGYWIIEKYGVRKFIAAYKLLAENATSQVFKEIYGVNLSELEREWLEYLKSKYGEERFTKTTILYLASSNPVIIYDDTYSDLEQASYEMKNILANLAYNFLETKTTIKVMAYSQVKKRFDELLRSHNVLILTLSNTTMFDNIIKAMKHKYLKKCNEGFSFDGIKNCLPSKNDILMLVDETYNGKIAGVIVGNSIEAIKNNSSLLLRLHPFSMGSCYIRKKLYVIFPSTLPKGEEGVSNIMALMLFIAFLAILFLEVVIRRVFSEV